MQTMTTMIMNLVKVTLTSQFIKKPRCSRARFPLCRLYSSVRGKIVIPVIYLKNNELKRERISAHYDETTKATRVFSPAVCYFRSIADTSAALHFSADSSFSLSRNTSPPSAHCAKRSDSDARPTVKTLLLCVPCHAYV